MKTFPHLFAKLFCSPLMITEPARFGFEHALLSHMEIAHARPLPGAAAEVPEGGRGRAKEDWLQFDRDVRAYREQARLENVVQRYGDIAVVKLSGAIDKHLTQFEMDCYGGADLADFDRAISLIANDRKISRVVMWINSPGGSVTGVPEAAARVAALTKTREVHAFVDAMACSAGYYIASQADHIAAAPTATLGSIGVYMALLDETRALEMEGYRIELIKAGKFKAMGASFKKLEDDERALLQQSVTDLHVQFKAAVKSGRRSATERGGHQTVSDSAMEGQWFDGKDALKERLVDELTTATLDEYVAGLLAA